MRNAPAPVLALVLALVPALVLALSACEASAPPVAQATAPSSAAPEVLLFATRPDAGVTTLHLASAAGTSELSAPLVTLSHHEGAVVRAAVHPTGFVLATLDAQASRDLSFASSLYRLAPGAGPARLVEDVVYASRPLVTADGRVFVSRGSPGEVGPSGRVDALTIDEVEPLTGAVRGVLSAQGFALFLAGAWERELVVYRVLPRRGGGPGGEAAIVAVDMDTGDERELAKVPDVARDFSVADGDVVFQDRAPDGLFVVLRLSLAGGPLREVARASAPRLAPFAWPSVGVALSDAQGLLLRAPDGRPGGDARVPGVRPEDVQQLLDVTPDRAWAVGLRHRPGRAGEPSLAPVPFVLSRRGALQELPAPEGARVSVAGFAAGALARGGW